VLLVFVAPGCPYSRALIAPLAARAAALSETDPVRLILSTGDEAANSPIFEPLSRRIPVLLQEDWEAGQLYHVPATPAVYLLDESAAVASGMALGAAAVLALAGTPSVPAGYDATPAPVRVPIGSARPLVPLQPGSTAPPFELPRLSGGHLTFSGHLTRRTLLVFSDPACAPCSALEPALAALLPRRTAPHVLIVSRRADRARVSRALRPRTLVDERGDVARRYGVLTAPAAFLVDEQGRISAGPAIGAQAVSSLIAAAAAEAAVTLPKAGPAASAPAAPGDGPLVSMILTTRDRPHFLRIALRCYAHQSYANRELIVVDDGDQWPADGNAITAAGGHLIRVEPGTRLGAKRDRGGEGRPLPEDGRRRLVRPAFSRSDGRLASAATRRRVPPADELHDAVSLLRARALGDPKIDRQQHAGRHAAL